MEKLIYVIEDDDNIRNLLKIALEGYSYKVEVFENAEDALKTINSKIPDLALFDIMLPGIDGITAVKELRQNPKFKNLPIIFLTAKDSEVEKIVGLDSGADDYITKPFSVLEFMARIRSIFRRFEDLKEPENIMKAGELLINNDTREVFVSNEKILLTFKEYELLKYLLENKHRAVSRDEILDKIWGYKYMGETRTVDIHIRSIRQKLGCAGNYITTVRGMGYRFNLEG